jgi:hypothetical protein
MLAVTVVAARRMQRRTACSSTPTSIAGLALHYWPAIAPRTATWARIARRPQRRSTLCRRSKHSRHRHFLFRGGQFCRVAVTSACTHPCHERPPASLAVARSQQTGRTHGTKERALEAQGCRTFPSTCKVPLFLAHRRRVLVRRGSPLLLAAAAAAVVLHRNITPISLPMLSRLL